MKLTKRQVQRIEGIGGKFDLRLIILYGSYARGTAQEKSDLDIAVSGKKAIDFEIQLELYSDLAEVLGDLKRELDLVTLEKKDPYFYFRLL